MGYLGYCILRFRQPWPGRLPVGVEGAAVTLIDDDGLCAAVSDAPMAGATRDVARATAYADVIACLSTDRTVLPLRYGCLFPLHEDVCAFLHGRRAEFTGLLDELDGCVEMGIRVLVPGVERPPPAHDDVMTNTGAGLAYLTSRRVAYVCRDAAREAGAGTAARIRHAFARFSLQARTVSTDMEGTVLVSMYFLIRREHILAFCSRFRRLQARGAYQLLLSGPWAPYSFVAVETTGVTP
jgi:hypothetical protein